MADRDWWLETANYLMTQSQQEIIEILDDAQLLKAVHEYLVNEDRIKDDEEEKL